MVVHLCKSFVTHPVSQAYLFQIEGGLNGYFVVEIKTMISIVIFSP